MLWGTCLRVPARRGPAPPWPTRLVDLLASTRRRGDVGHRAGRLVEYAGRRPGQQGEGRSEHQRRGCREGDRDSAHDRCRGGQAQDDGPLRAAEQDAGL
jgi:hypothetical protein